MKPLLIPLTIIAIVVLAGIGYGFIAFMGQGRQVIPVLGSSSTAKQTTLNNGGVVVVFIPKGAGVFGGPNFTPSNITVVIGVNNTIEWVNEDNLSPHSVTPLVLPSSFPTFGPVILDSNQSYTMKLTLPGTYIYYCLWHPGWLRGTIVVKSQ